MHFRTFGVGLLAVFGMSMLMPFAPGTVGLLSAWGVVAGFRRVVRPGWRRVPLLGWRLPYSSMDGMLWVGSMGVPLMFAVSVLWGSS